MEATIYSDKGVLLHRMEHCDNDNQIKSEIIAHKGCIAVINDNGVIRCITCGDYKETFLIHEGNGYTINKKRN